MLNENSSKWLVGLKWLNTLCCECGWNHWTGRAPQNSIAVVKKIAIKKHGWIRAACAKWRTEQRPVFTGRRSEGDWASGRQGRPFLPPVALAFSDGGENATRLVSCVLLLVAPLPLLLRPQPHLNDCALAPVMPFRSFLCASGPRLRCVSSRQLPIDQNGRLARTRTRTRTLFHWLFVRNPINYIHTGQNESQPEEIMTTVSLLFFFFFSFIVFLSSSNASSIALHCIACYLFVFTLLHYWLLY